MASPTGARARSSLPAARSTTSSPSTTADRAGRGRATRRGRRGPMAGPPLALTPVLVPDMHGEPNLREEPPVHPPTPPPDGDPPPADLRRARFERLYDETSPKVLGYALRR